MLVLHYAVMIDIEIKYRARQQEGKGDLAKGMVECEKELKR